jgi:phosphoribosylanthranilate isomerase
VLLEPRDSRAPGVKICGVTTVEDAELAVRLGASDLGVNFYPPSPRSIGVERAREIRAVVPESCRLVGVFVNHSRSEVEEISGAVGLDLLQFHGDESIGEIGDLASRSIRAIRPERDLEPARLRELGSFWALLLDAPRAKSSKSSKVALYGGTGESWNYLEARRVLDFDAGAERGPSSSPDGSPSMDLPSTGPIRLFLAGGVRPENVRSVLDSLPGLYGIDVCSGVEVSPGIKDRKRMEQLFSEVQRFLEGKEGQTWQ